MGLRDAFSSGGGNLNNVDGAITALEFSTEFPYQSDKPRKKSDFKSLWCNVSITVDGAEAARVEPVFAGNAEAWDISEDGMTITPVEDREKPSKLFGNIIHLLGSMIDHDFADPCEDWAVGDPIDLSSLVDQRFRFVQVKDPDAPKQKGKDGKLYDRTRLEVSAYLGEVEAAPKSVAAKNGKSNGAAKTAQMGKKGKAEVNPLQDKADALLVDILTDADDNSVTKANLKGVVTRKMLGKPQRKELCDLIFSPGFFEREAGWTNSSKAIELA